MAYNKEAMSKETVILPIDIANAIKEDAKKAKRSKSAQMAYILEAHYRSDDTNEMEH